MCGEEDEGRGSDSMVTRGGLVGKEEEELEHGEGEREAFHVGGAPACE